MCASLPVQEVEETPLIPGWEDPGEVGTAIPLQYFCLGELPWDEEPGRLSSP